MTEIVLPWPTKELGSNSRTHWRAKAAKVKAYRQAAAVLTRQSWVGHLPEATLEFTFYPPDRRKRDLHNMPSAMKAAIDGIADGMKCDDNLFKVVWPTEFSEPVKGGSVVVTIKEPTNRDT